MCGEGGGQEGTGPGIRGRGQGAGRVQGARGWGGGRCETPPTRGFRASCFIFSPWQMPLPGALQSPRWALRCTCSSRWRPGVGNGQSHV